MRNENQHLITRQGVEGPPDLVVEVLSPSNAVRDRREKREVYARAGVAEMWIVDRKARQIEVHALAQGLKATPTIVREPKVFSPAIFPGLRIDTAKLFKPV